MITQQTTQFKLCTKDYITTTFPAWGHFLLPESSVQFSSVAHSCLTLCDPSGLQHARLPCPSPSPRVCWDSYPSGQWCHPTISSSVAPFCPSPPAFSLSQLQGLFQWVDSFHQVGKVLQLQLQNQFFQWIFRVEWAPDPFRNWAKVRERCLGINGAGVVSSPSNIHVP